MGKACKVCGKPFNRNGAAKCCSKECMATLKRRHDHHDWESADGLWHGTCEHCGSEFAAVHKRKYCTDACGIRQQLDKAITERSKRKQPCKQCGKPLPKHRTVYCSDECEALFVKGKDRLITDAVAAQRIATLYNTITYVGGYKGEGSTINVRCKICGGEFGLYSRALRQTYEAKCPHCAEKQREADAEQAERARLVRRLMAALRKQARALEDVAYRTRKCIVCGAVFIAERGTTGTQLCSTACMIRRKKEHKHNAHHKRRVIYKGSSDLITLRELYQRDKGTCYICGIQCDFNDMHIDGTTYITGATYPSIDHVYPISKGGMHTWDNVRLACCLCNRTKSDTVMTG